MNITYKKIINIFLNKSKKMEWFENKKKKIFFFQFLEVLEKV